ncbi:MAG: PAS domain S-box protein [Acidobacteria bacterium]|nr:PAS domain S-box protein [Acidobacteriota bacterium]
MPRKVQERLDAADEILRALRSGEVDAIVASGPDGDRVYTLKGADEAYRLMIQNMGEGALTIAPDGLILFSNEKLASMLATPHERVIGSSFHNFIVPEDAGIFSALLTQKLAAGAKCEVRLKANGGRLIPVALSANRLKSDGVHCFCVIVADLTDQKRNEEVLHALSARLLRLQDEDRRRIARGLHNGAFQHLAALEFKLTLVGQDASAELPPAARRNLTECLELVGECCQDLGNLAYLIQPPLLEEQGLGSALRAYVNGYNRRLGPQISIDLPRRMGRLPAHVETTLFRVAQEALTNIERHSGSATAEIRFLRKPGELLLEIADHGCGISRKTLKQLNEGTGLSGIGIAGMRERIRQLGGLIKIYSSSRGTRVQVNLPTKSTRLGRHPA